MKSKLKPLISVVIPSFNHANLIQKALQSLIDQTYQNWEAIIIDNHSTDETNKVLKRYKDTRIKCLKINNRGVIAKSRNLGIKIAKGEWIAFLDSDDYWTSDKLSVCVEYMSKKCDFIYHDMERISNKFQFFGRKLNKTRQLKNPIVIDLLLKGNLISNSSTIVKKKILEKVGMVNESKSLIAAEDYNTWLKISTLTDLFVYIPKRLGFYFVHEHNISQKNMYEPTKEATKDFLGFLCKNEKLKFKSRLKYLSFNNNYLNSSFRKIKKEFLFILKNGTFNLKIYVLIKMINFYLNKLKKIA